MLSVHLSNDHTALTPEETSEMQHDVADLNTGLKSGGLWVFGAGLQPPADSQVVRIVEGQQTTDLGLFAPSDNFLAGYWVIKTDSEDLALEWAARAARACREPVEVRPFIEEYED